MQSSLLFHYKLKRWGWLVLIPTALLGSLTLLTDWTPSFLTIEYLNSKGTTLHQNLLNEILGILFIVSSLMVAFTKEETEDEMIGQLRLQSLLWATFWNYVLLAVAMLLAYDFNFLLFMEFNMFTILVLFILRFNLKLWKMRKTLSHEE